LQRQQQGSARKTPGRAGRKRPAAGERESGSGMGARAEGCLCCCAGGCLLVLFFSLNSPPVLMSNSSRGEDRRRRN